LNVLRAGSERPRLKSSSTQKLEVCGYDVGEALCGGKLERAELGGWASTEHQASVDLPCDPQWDDEAAFPLASGKRIGRLASEHPSEGGPRDRNER